MKDKLVSLIPNHTHKWSIAGGARVLSCITEKCDCGVSRFISQQWWTTDYYFEGRLIKRARLTPYMRNRITQANKERLNEV